MQNYFTPASVFTLLCCLIFGALYAFLLYRKNKNLSTSLTYILAAGRTLAVGLICWLLFSPLIKTISYTLEKPVIVLAHDNSLSIAQVQPKDFNPEAYRQDMINLQQKLAEKYEVRTYSFSDSVKTGLDFSNKGKFSNAAAFVRRITDELQNRNIGAVIIASDGIFNRGGNPVYELNKLRAPVYTIALGDTIPKRDVLVANVNYNDLVYLDNDFIIEAQVQAYQSKNENVRLTVSEAGKTVFEKTLPINSGAFIQDVPIKLHAASPGVKKYTIALSELRNEITVQNNKQDFFVEVVDGKEDILIVANAPHPDIAAIRQSLGKNKNYKVTLAMADELAGINVDDYGSIILYQLPAVQNPANSFFQKLHSSKASLWYIIGAQSNLNAFNLVQKAVRINGAASGTLQEVFPLQNKDFMLFSVNEGLGEQLRAADPLLSPFGRLNITGNTTSLLKQRIGAIPTENPLLFFVNEEHRKTAYLLGEGLWRWKLNDNAPDQDFSFVDDVISKTIQYLSVKDDKRKFRVFPAKHTFDEHEHILLNANLYNDNNMPVNDPEVQINIRNEAGKVFNYTFLKTETAYRLDAGIFPKGNYTFEAVVNFGGKALHAEGAFYVKEITIEYQQTTANHQILNAMAIQNGGRKYSPAQLSDISADLEKSGKIKTLSYEDRKFEALINQEWLFALILLLLATEWFIRKRNGEI